MDCGGEIRDAWEPVGDWLPKREAPGLGWLLVYSLGLLLRLRRQDIARMKARAATAAQTPTAILPVRSSSFEDRAGAVGAEV